MESDETKKQETSKWDEEWTQKMTSRWTKGKRERNKTRERKKERERKREKERKKEKSRKDGNFGQKNRSRLGHRNVLAPEVNAMGRRKMK